MNAGSSSSGRRGFSNDVELNIASIVDCFTVLITYMLAAASFISIGVIESGVTKSSIHHSQSKDDSALESGIEPIVQIPEGSLISIKLRMDRSIDLNTFGSLKTEAQISGKKQDPVQMGEWNLSELESTIRNLREKNPSLEKVVIHAEDTLQYQEIIRVMEVIRKIIPVYIASAEAL